MKLIKITYRLYYVALALAAMMATAACSSKDIDVLPDEPSYTISLRLRTNGIFTRAEGPTWGDEYKHDSGINIDNYINSVDLFLLDNDNNISTRLYALEGEESNSAVYTYVCTVTENTPGVTIDKVNRVAKFNGQLKIMAVANVTNQYAPWIDSDWKSRQIPFKVSYGVSDSWYIPMWGVNSYDGVEIKDKELKILEDIDLLRAVSKIIIKLDSSISNDFEIQSVSMADETSLFYTGGYGLPMGAFDVEQTTELNLTGCFNPVMMENIPTMSSPAFKYTSDSKTEVITYVPESKIDGDTPFAFNVTLKSKHDDRPPFSGTLYLSNYSADGRERLDAYTEVVRNHEYEFTIRLAELQFFTTVKKWEFGGKVHIDM